ncbi:MAG: DNA-3-methyladenine glycosylase I [Polyangiales bacterium]|nr:DNA-3-methyladenine glycosylase I [Sandaracinaceae bacterium]
MSDDADLPCGWAPAHDALYRGYHDTEWGVPERDSRALWEKFQLDGFQAGLAWITILRKRASMREEFEGFVPEVIARWDDARVERALSNPGIIRSRAKVQATIGNAKAYLRMREGGLEFSDYLWAFVDGKPLDGRLESWRSVPAKTALSERLAKDMKKRGFTFCGPTIVYACMQAVGMVNDHEIRCPRYREVKMSN